MLCPTSKPGLRQTSTCSQRKICPQLTANYLASSSSHPPFGYEVIRLSAHGAALWTRAVILTAKPLWRIRRGKRSAGTESSLFPGGFGGRQVRCKFDPARGG